MVSVNLDLPDLEATHCLGEQLGRSLSAGTVLLLQGDLGSGKTSLVQGLGRGLGIADPIVSPTFTLVNEYPEGRVPLYHLDLYRLTLAEVDALYLDTYWDGQEYAPGIVAIEWAERLSYRPAHYIEIVLQATERGDRHATLTSVGRVRLPQLSV
ncbi:tRNA (adenosine(37)-N6)-threonylcarbamoyltransferase complex ATPase subunit type 1 TsaE [Leptolyngbya sp. AN02str]|uniref:tRNA (adenosine(37)-N6)-threonylcarbamoyltransferase complex ATPase subunit type 1 TsaE n=1 Tax=Leptolyngbya sp. AN02str TaxID=3423363 RepID=UPI003D310C71